MIFNPKWLPLQLAEISNSKKKTISQNFSMKFRSQITYLKRKHYLKLQKLNFLLELCSINRINTFLKRKKYDMKNCVA
jgi:hypothetical protein